MTYARWDIRAHAAILIGEVKFNSLEDHEKVIKKLRKLFPKVQLDTFRSATAWVYVKNREKKEIEPCCY